MTSKWGRAGQLGSPLHHVPMNTRLGVLIYYWYKQRYLSVLMNMLVFGDIHTSRYRCDSEWIRYYRRDKSILNTQSNTLHKYLYFAGKFYSGFTFFLFFKTSWILKNTNKKQKPKCYKEVANLISLSFEMYFETFPFSHAGRYIKGCSHYTSISINIYKKCLFLII